MAPHWLFNAFGIAAGLCSMASFIPQIVKIVRERDASSVSLRMYAVMMVGFTCWVTYGALSNAWPVVASNVVCLVLTITTFALRLRYGDRRA